MKADLIGVRCEHAVRRQDDVIFHERLGILHPILAIVSENRQNPRLHVCLELGLQTQVDGSEHRKSGAMHPKMTSRSVLFTGAAISTEKELGMTTLTFHWPSKVIGHTMRVPPPFCLPLASLLPGFFLLGGLLVEA